MVPDMGLPNTMSEVEYDALRVRRPKEPCTRVQMATYVVLWHVPRYTFRRPDVVVYRCKEDRNAKPEASDVLLMVEVSSPSSKYAGPQTRALADLGELKIPAAVRPSAGAIVELTDQVCPELLDEEYARLARSVVAKRARERPAPVQAQAFEQGVIPYIPALDQVGTAAWLSEIGRA